MFICIEWQFCFHFSCRESGAEREVFCRHRQWSRGWCASSLWVPVEEISSAFPQHMLVFIRNVSSLEAKRYLFIVIVSCFYRHTLGSQIAPCSWGEFRRWWMKKIFRTISKSTSKNPVTMEERFWQLNTSLLEKAWQRSSARPKKKPTAEDHLLCSESQDINHMGVGVWDFII